MPPLRVLTGAAVILAYQLFFVLRGLSAHFAADDMMNIYYFWGKGPWRLIQNLVLFCSTYQRPMGGVFYSLLYRFFGLNPLPYHVAITCLILVNTIKTFGAVSGVFFIGCAGGHERDGSSRGPIEGNAASSQGAALKHA